MSKKYTKIIPVMSKKRSFWHSLIHPQQNKATRASTYLQILCVWVCVCVSPIPTHPVNSINEMTLSLNRIRDDNEKTLVQSFHARNTHHPHNIYIYVYENVQQHHQWDFTIYRVKNKHQTHNTNFVIVSSILFKWQHKWEFSIFRCHIKFAHFLMYGNFQIRFYVNFMNYKFTNCLFFS